ncbi:hypothetical protein LOZ51_006707 [Ophidiomyces ophidiicola]|nr:hypothetical protein LOZ54_006724 [Ophidiomyces ophidiicola]KAI1984129.1 hypothetical protein LOZ51_006707 [Ophidiomyces ophidiicola]
MNTLFLENEASSHNTSFAVDIIDTLNLSLRACDGALPFPASFGSALAIMYGLASDGRLPFDAEVVFQLEIDTITSLEDLDQEIVSDIKQAANDELDCQICLALLVDPCTTPCGHSFCQRCLGRILNQSDLCPICRRRVSQNLYLGPQNLRLSNLLSTFFSLRLAERREAIREDRVGEFDESQVPLFVCTLSFPSTRTFLYVFEPRYRLMIRRVIDSGHRKFGMVAPGESRQVNGDTQAFTEYGTLLEISRLSPLGDGRCIIRATGQYRFRVLESTMTDGYAVGKIERVDDISIPEEEAREAFETESAPLERPSMDELDHLSTLRLFQIGLTFVAKCRASSVRWLDNQTYQLYGPPPADPRLFSFWFASVMPRPEEDRYPLLIERSVRERLKMAVRWIKKLETEQWALKSPQSLANHYISNLQTDSTPFVTHLRRGFGLFVLPLLIFFVVYKFFFHGATLLPNTSNVSFSILPFSLSFTYSYQPPPITTPNTRSRDRERNLNPNVGFVVTNFMDQGFIPGRIVLASIFVLCIARVVRRVVEIVNFERDRQRTSRVNVNNAGHLNPIDDVIE